MDEICVFKPDCVQVLAKSAVAYAVAQEVLRLGNSMNLQMRVATGDTVVSGIHIPEGTNVWLCPQQVSKLFSSNMLCISSVVRM
jgi:cytochrome P450